MIKKLLSIILTVALTISMTTPIYADAIFKDAGSIQHLKAVTELVGQRVITGYPDNTFRPQGTLTRAEACAIITRLTGGKASGKADFKDVVSNHWAMGYIAYCASEGIVVGYGDGNFGPEDKLTGSAWSKMILVALGYDADAQGMIGNKWIAGVTELAKKENLYDGIKEYQAEGAISRDDACQIAYNGTKTEANPKTPSAPAVSSDKLEKLSYEFSNTRKAFGYALAYRIPRERYTLVYGDTIRALELYQRSGLWQGNCFGISGSVEMLNKSDNAISASSFKAGASMPKDLSLGDQSNSLKMNLKEFIEALQIVQFDDEVQKEILLTNADKLNPLCGMVDGYEKGTGDPVIITVFGKEGAHALVGYQLLSVSSTESRIMVYDSNYPQDASRYIKINKNAGGAYTGWSYPINDTITWGSNSADSMISYASYSEINKVWENRMKEESSTMMLVTTNKDIEITRSNGSPVATVKNGEVIPHQKNVYEFQEVAFSLDKKDENEDTTSLWIPVEQLSIRKTGENGNNADFMLSVTHVQQSASIVTGAGKLDVDVNDSSKTRWIHIDSSEAGKKYKITLRSSLKDKNEPEEILVEGNVLKEDLEIGRSQGNSIRAGLDETKTSLIEDGVVILPRKSANQPQTPSQPSQTPTTRYAIGTVLDAVTKEPAPNKRVEFRSESQPSYNTTVYTDSNGGFEIVIPSSIENDRCTIYVDGSFSNEGSDLQTGNVYVYHYDDLDVSVEYVNR